MDGWVVIVLLLYAVGASSVFNLDEIQYLKYGINLDTIPVTLPKTGGTEHVIMSSKYGQKYSCVLPEVQTTETKDLDFENVLTTFPGRFNQPNHCLHRTKDWWTYRVCYGNVIQQYHQPDRRKQRQLPKEYITIGVFERDLDWKQELQKPGVRYYEQLPHSHKQYFTKGDVCDETGQPRKAIVSYTCDPEAMHEFISYIGESEVCSYRVVINTARMCQHRFFMPGHGAIKHNINCSPLVKSVPAVLPSLTSKDTPPNPKPFKRGTKFDKEPSWVGNYPTSPNFTLKDYLDDISNEAKQKPLRALKKMFRTVVKDMKADIASKRVDKTAEIKNPELATIDLDKLTDKDIDNIFKSEEFESTINQLAESTQRELENIRMAVTKPQPRIEVKVIYRDANGGVKISDADGDSPAIRDTVLQLMDYNAEQREEQRRHQSLLNSYHYHASNQRKETTPDYDAELADTEALSDSAEADASEEGDDASLDDLPDSPDDD